MNETKTLEQEFKELFQKLMKEFCTANHCNIEFTMDISKDVVYDIIRRFTTEPYPGLVPVYSAQVRFGIIPVAVPDMPTQAEETNYTIVADDSEPIPEAEIIDVSV